MAILKVKTIALVAMIIGIFATFYVFMLRYGWYVTPENSLALDVGFGIFLVICGIVWFIFPSKILMVAACVALFAYPPFYDSRNFVALDWKYFPFMGICMFFLAAAVEMRKRAQRPGAAD